MTSPAGKHNWIFTDGDLPPHGDGELPGHEALIITNVSDQSAEMTIDILFADKDPKKGIRVGIKGERVLCIRLDEPIGEEKFQIPFGQYSLVLHSSIPVVATFGRLDVRQPNLAYYVVDGFGY